jgi:hypothetical protein
VNILRTWLVFVAIGTLVNSAARADEQKSYYAACSYFGRAFKHGMSTTTTGYIGAVSRSFPLKVRGNYLQLAQMKAEYEWRSYVRARVGDDVDGHGGCQWFSSQGEAATWINDKISGYRRQSAQVVSTDFEATGD